MHPHPDHVPLWSFEVSSKYTVLRTIHTRLCKDSTNTSSSCDNNATSREVVSAKGLFDGFVLLPMQAAIER